MASRSGELTLANSQEENKNLNPTPTGKLILPGTWGSLEADKILAPGQHFDSVCWDQEHRTQQNSTWTPDPQKLQDNKFVLL